MKTKKEHYVPERYLEAFAQDDQLYVFDKEAGKVFVSNIRDTASQRYYYDVPELDQETGVSQVIEKFFHPFEGAAATVLNDLRSSLDEGSFVAVTKNQRIDLSLFLALQMLRTPEARERFVQLTLALKKQEFLSWVRDRRSDFPMDESMFDLVMDEDHQLRTHARAILDHDLRDRLAEIIYQHYWIVLENPFQMPFITSDHPACNHGTVAHPVRSMQGLASFGAEVLFPLSPTHLLLIVERQAFPQASRLDGRLEVLNSAENVVYYNHWQVHHSFRFLYSITDDFSLAQSMVEETPDLANPRNQRIGVRIL